MDSTQLKVKNKLGLNYSQVNGYKIIYDFISSFSFCQATGNNIYAKDVSLYEIKLQHGLKKINIPFATRRLIEKIGTERIHLFFSPHAYPRKFESFCKNLLAEKAQLREYYTPGLICIEKIDVVELEFEDGVA